LGPITATFSLDLTSRERVSNKEDVLYEKQRFLIFNIILKLTVLASPEYQF